MIRIPENAKEGQGELSASVDGEKLTDSKFIIDIIPKAITIYNDNEFVNSIMFD